MTNIKRSEGKGLFDYENRLSEINEMGYSLQKLERTINFEIFRPDLKEIFTKQAKGPGGASHYDYVFMFKVLTIQELFQLSDEQTEFQIKDRLSFQKFLGIGFEDKVPDRNTIRNFREQLSKNGVLKKLFKRFYAYLQNQGIVGKQGVIVDATFIDVPKQRNSREDNQTIKKGDIPEEWEEHPNKMRQKDTDARWMTKNKEEHYGYKNHVKTDKDTKIISNYEVTSANVHDSQAMESLIEEEDKGKVIYADSAYAGNPINQMLEKNEMINMIHEKGYRNKPLTKEQKELNKEKSKTRARVEHIFGFMQNSMKASYTRVIGQKRASVKIGLMNLVYNMCRYEQMMRLGLVK